MGHYIGRSRPIVERIGKKYQYIAYYELLARLSDNLMMEPEYDSTEPKKFDGPWQGHERDIDPSLLIRKTENNEWGSFGESLWWKPNKIILDESTIEERTKWLWSDQDIPIVKNEIIVHNPMSGEDWVVMDSFWRVREPNDGTSDNSMPNREIWFRIQSALVRCKDFPKLQKHLIDKKNLCPGEEFRTCEMWSHFYLAEYPWHPSASGISKNWTLASYSTHWGVPVDSLTLTEEYYCEHLTNDLSIDEGIRIKMPSAWLIKHLGLRLVDGRNIQYVESDGKTAFFDPSLIEKGPSASLMRKDLIQKLLKKHDLMLVWTIGGEKNVYQPLFYGGNYYSGVYNFDGKAIHGNKWLFKQLPEGGPRKL